MTRVSIAQIEAALIYIEEACRDEDPIRLTVAGCIAYALHNTPYKIRAAQRTGDTVYPHRGGGFVPGLCDASAEIKAAYRAFFRDVSIRTCADVPPAPVPESVLDAWYWVFIHARTLQYHHEWREEARAPRYASLIEQARDARLLWSDRLRAGNRDT